MQNHLTTILLSSRPAFLVLTPVCVLLGLSAAVYLQADINAKLAWLVLIGALAAHIAVNLLNEYSDFKSGLDFKTNRTAFSGGSGALPEHPEFASLVLLVGIATLILTVSIGLYLTAVRGNIVLFFGIIGIAIIVSYTQWLNRMPLLCLIAPGTGFGVLMVIGIYTVITGTYAALIGQLSIITCLLINNLLLLNQYPDIAADASIGRKTLPIRYGISISNTIYAIFAALSYGVLAYNIVLDRLPVISITALLPAIAAVYALYGAIKHKASLGQHPAYLAANVVAAIATPLLLGLSLVYAANQ